MRALVSTGLALCLLTSCMADMASDNIESGMQIIQGQVTDTDDNPLSHIKVTLDWGTGDPGITLYSSLNGKFISELGIDRNELPATLTITLEDIDGEENGGEFNPLTDEITIFEEELSSEAIRLDLHYRLTRATVSESNLQSL